MDFTSLNAQDAKKIAELEAQCFTLPWSVEQCSLVFKQKHFFSFGLKLKQGISQLIAYISFYQVLDEMEILNIAVLPQFRRNGLGQFLLINTLQIASNMGMTTVVLEVRPSNVAARKLYEGIGFKHIGNRPKYYTDTGEDALIYKLIT